MGLRIEPACEAGLSAGMRRERVPPQIRKKERSLLKIMRNYTGGVCKFLLVFH